LVKNGAHKTSDREPTRLVNKQLSDLWKNIPYGRRLRVTVSPNLSGRKSLLLPSDA